MPLQFGQVLEGVHLIELARMNEAHVQITYFSAIQRFIEERVFSMQNGFLQCSLD